MSADREAYVEDARERLRSVRASLGTIAVQVGVLLLVAVVFLGLAFLVYEGSIEPDVLIFVSGVVMGFFAKVFLDARDTR